LTLATGSDFGKLLETVPTRPMRRRLVRCVAALDFLESNPPRYLYTSGRPGRCNPRSVDCLYFSETERVAELEYRRRFVDVAAATEPRLTFFAQVDLKHVIDLSRPAVLKAVGITSDDVVGGGGMHLRRRGFNDSVWRSAASAASARFDSRLMRAGELE
jgi:hypothetical protein